MIACVRFFAISNGLLFVLLLGCAFPAQSLSRPPSELGDLRLWLAAWDVNGDGEWINAFASGDEIPIWDDLSGRNNDAYAYHDGHAPSFSEAAVNGMPSVRFNGYNYPMKIRGNILSGESGFTVFFVCRPNIARKSGPLMSLNAKTGWHVESGFFVTPEIRIQAGNRSVLFDQSLPTDRFSILCLRMNADLRIQDAEAFLDGKPVKVKAARDGGSRLSFGKAGSYQGIGGVSSSSLDGEIAETLWYEGALSDAAMAQVASYLGTLYGIRVSGETQGSNQRLLNRKIPASKRLHAVKKDVIASRIGQGPWDWLGRARIEKVEDYWVLIVFQSHRHGTMPLGKTAFVRFSKDEGKSWTLPNQWFDGSRVDGMPLEVPRPDAELSEGELTVAPNGDLLLFVNYRTVGKQFGCLQYRSQDGGRSWVNEGLLLGKQELWMPHDSVVKDGSIYMGVIVDEGADRKPPLKVALLHSENSGQSWELRSMPGEKEDDLNESGIAVGPDGMLTMVFRTRDEKRAMMRKSPDMGRTWGPLRDITYAVGVVQQPALNVFESEPERLYLAGRDRVEEHSQRNGLWYSDDLGETWTSIDLDSEVWRDSGYGNVLKMENGDLYYVGYLGNDEAADTWGYVVPRSLLRTH